MNYKRYRYCLTNITFIFNWNQFKMIKIGWIRFVAFLYRFHNKLNALMQGAKNTHAHNFILITSLDRNQLKCHAICSHRSNSSKRKCKMINVKWQLIGKKRADHSNGKQKGEQFQWIFFVERKHRPLKYKFMCWFVSFSLAVSPANKYRCPMQIY